MTYDMDTTSPNLLSRVDIFYWTENNRVHPLSLPGKCVTIEAPAGLAAWDYVEEARAQGHNIPNGSSRCGVREIQTDDGIWNRVSSNKQARSLFEFKSWDDLEAEDAAEVSVEVTPEVEVTQPNVWEIVR